MKIKTESQNDAVIHLEPQSFQVLWYLNRLLTWISTASDYSQKGGALILPPSKSTISEEWRPDGLNFSSLPMIHGRVIHINIIFSRQLMRLGRNVSYYPILFPISSDKPIFSKGKKKVSYLTGLVILGKSLTFLNIRFSLSKREEQQYDLMLQL